jgi:hypothetical protein
MNMNRYKFAFTRYFKILMAVLLLIGSVSPTASIATSRPVATSLSAPMATSRPVKTGVWNVEGLSPNVLQLALQAAESAKKQGISKGKTLGIIDFSLPSTKQRFWVLDMEKKKVLFHILVAHGKGSGENFARSFSNLSGSFQSSLGLYLTESPYEGEHGYSLRLQGLEEGINDQAKARAIVIHGAWYVSQNMIAQQQRLGRSLGCPAVEDSVVKPLIDDLKDGNLIFAYYPDEHWLSTSRFLKTSNPK